MDKTYKITSLERKTTTTGKAVANTTLADETGATHEKVSIWSDFQNFANLNVGDFVTGNLYTNDKGYKSLYPPKTGTKPAGGAYTANKGGAMAKLVEKKQEGIRVSQENKEHGIMTSSTIRMATDIAIAEYNNARAFTYGDNLAENIRGWRTWFLDNWEVKPEDTTPF